ncbi:type II toxin-antitoxin system antitoxin SocA domain-containing protein [Xanthomonas sp. 3058]|uniref:Panacea domain-containing protein n=1 Tax=Xanthomonas sp. 3058 TaxID=3035314 RepID=UPI001620120E|nr:type II toxin-antitoxin system antitoxin SocA domain-containing protein [Xanthomonas sp. 3058]MBB5862571.1 putative phage-associated protein [Xanthomonas sp. 3058]
MTNTVLSVANNFIERGLREGKPISNMKLQKLLYFAQGHCLGMFGRPLVDEAPEAWQYGPVFPSAYHAFKQYGAQPILSQAVHFNPFTGQYSAYPPVQSSQDLGLIEAVWNGYKDRTPIQLSEMSHAPGGPWQKAYGTYRNADISAEAMTEFFRPKAATD